MSLWSNCIWRFMVREMASSVSLFFVPCMSFAIAISNVLFWYNKLPHNDNYLHCTLRSMWFCWNSLLHNRTLCKICLGSLSEDLMLSTPQQQVPRWSWRPNIHKSGGRSRIGMAAIDWPLGQGNNPGANYTPGGHRVSSDKWTVLTLVILVSVMIMLTHILWRAWGFSCEFLFVKCMSFTIVMLTQHS